MTLRIQVPLAEAPHEYVLGAGVLATLGDVAAGVAEPGRCLLVTDEGVAAAGHDAVAADALRTAGFRPATVVVPAGDAAKTPAQAERIWRRLCDEGVERGGIVVAVGGGAVGDLAGFCASTWLRGVGLVHVPTTLLAMADSSVGGKTGVNLEAGKNLVGSIHLPLAVVADTATLRTLARRHLAAGAAEVVKCAVLSDREALERLRGSAGAALSCDESTLTDLVALAVGVKIAHVRSDLRETTGSRALLNLGHTTAHALEAEAGFEGLLHGEAVAVGLVVAARIAAARGLCGAALVERVTRALEAFGLPVALPDGSDPGAVADLTRHDKKRRGARRMMVLPLEGTGAGVFEVATDELLASL